MIIDYHSHIKWDYKTQTYDVDAFLNDMKENQIDLRVVSALNGRNIREQNQFISDLVSQHSDTLVGAAIINPKDPDCLDEMKRVINDSNFKAIELDSLEHNYYPETFQEILDQVFEMAEEKKLLINVFTGWGPRTMPAQWAFYARRFPGLKFIILHMGTTDFGYGCIDLIPTLDNLYVETSCMYELPILKKAFAKIPIERFLFGSHFPDKLTVCSIGTFELLKLDKKQQEHLFYKNAQNLLNLEETN